MSLHNGSMNLERNIDNITDIIESHKVETQQFTRANHLFDYPKHRIFDNTTIVFLKLTLIVAMAIASAGPVQAEEVFDQFFRYTDKEHKAFFQGAPGESVDPFTGTLHIVHEDLVLPGKAGFDLRIVRRYNSKIWQRVDSAELSNLLAEEEHSYLGYGWSFHMGRLKNPRGDGIGGTCSERDFPVFEEPDGTMHVFYTWCQQPDPTGRFHTLISKDNWKMERENVLASSFGSLYSIHILSPTGVRYDFFSWGDFNGINEPVWWVTSITDPAGNRISINYGTYVGMISSIVDSYDREIHFSYDYAPEGFLTSRLKSMEVNGKIYTYEYTSQTTLAGDRRFLTSVTPPEGPGYHYSYYDNVGVAYNKYALKSITYTNGGTITYEYGSENFFTGHETVPFSVVKTRTVGGRAVTSGTWRYSYSLSGLMHLVTIERPDGMQDTYKMYGFGYVVGLAASGSTWKVGLPQEIARANRAEVETFTWESSDSPISSTTYAAPAYDGYCNPSSIVWDNDVRIPLLTRREVTRDGATYVTSNSSFDTYGQPQMVSESGQYSRLTNWRYFSDTDSNIVRGKPILQEVCVQGECFKNTWTYNGPGHAKDSETLAGVNTTFGYDQYGNLTRVTNTLGQSLLLDGYVTGKGTPTSLYFKNAFSISRITSWEGWITSETNGRVYTTSYALDAIGRIKILDPPGTSESTHYTYATDGSKVDLTRGSYTKTTNLDGFGRVISTSDSEGVLTSMRYDNMGRNWFKSYPYDSSIGEVGEKLDFDGLGRVIQQTKAYRPAAGTCEVPGACTVTHSFSQNCITSTVSRTSGDTAVTKRCNELFGNPDEQRLLSVTDAENYLWQYGNNAYGNVKTVTAPLSKGNRSYGYEPTTQFLTSETTGESGNTSYGRNTIGQMTSKTDARGVKATYGYNDPLSRLRTITYQNGSPDDVSKDYDNANNVTKIASTNGGTIEPSYDEVNRVYSQKWTYSGKLYTTTYNYDSKGCLYSMTYPTGTIVTMTCDSANRVKTISIGSSSIVNRILYHPSGQVKSMTFGNGKSTTLTYDDRSRAKTIASSGVIGLTYGYDGADNVVSFNNTVVPNSSRTMTYTKLDQLWTSVAQSLWGSAVYDYDELGNRTMKSVGSYTTTYTYGYQNRLDSAEGGPAPFKTMTFAWDLAGRLASSSDGVSYLYDGLGRRVQKTEPTQTTLYHYDASGRIISETSPTGAKIRDYIYLGNKLVAVDGCITVSPPSACTERQWYHTDIAGSVLARSDSAGNVVRFDYQPWGEPWTAPTTAAGDRQYNGRIFDSGTGFHDYGGRMYWPEIGRFISVDIAGPSAAVPATFNRYAYVLNNPYKYVDPNGHVATWATGLIGLGLGLAYGAITSYLSEEGFNWNAVTYWGGVGTVAGLTLGLGVNAYLAGTAAVGVAELTAGTGTAVGTATRGGAAAVENAPNIIEGLGDISHGGAIDADVALNAAQKWLDAGYEEIAPGVYRSADALRQFRMTTADLLGSHGQLGPHIHFEALDELGEVIENLHVPLLPDASFMLPNESVVPEAAIAGPEIFINP